MAGAIPIMFSPRDLGLLRRLTFRDLRLVLTDLDELGWEAARASRGYACPWMPMVRASTNRSRFASRECAVGRGDWSRDQSTRLHPQQERRGRSAAGSHFPA